MIVRVNGSRYDKTDVLIDVHPCELCDLQKLPEVCSRVRSMVKDSLGDCLDKRFSWSKLRDPSKLEGLYESSFKVDVDQLRSKICNEDYCPYFTDARYECQDKYSEVCLINIIGSCKMK